MPYSKRVLITGGTGLIGRELYAPLAQHGLEAHVLTIDEENPPHPHVVWWKGNLFDENFVTHVCNTVRPAYLLNLAWCTGGDYQTANTNFDFVRAGLTLLKHFAANGGKRAVLAGTCMEYAPQDKPLTETDAIAPQNLYARCKNNLHCLAQDFCQANDISLAYGRVFYVYGHNEHPSRLTASIITRLQQGQRVQINCSQLERDYMYTKDIAAAFVALLASCVQGDVNICTGKAISLAHYARALASKLGKEDLLVLQQLPTPQPPLIVGDNTRLLTEVGFTPTYTLESALHEILH